MVTFLAGCFVAAISDADAERKGLFGFEMTPRFNELESKTQKRLCVGKQ